MRGNGAIKAGAYIGTIIVKESHNIMFIGIQYCTLVISFYRSISFSRTTPRRFWTSGSAGKYLLPSSRLLRGGTSNDLRCPALQVAASIHFYIWCCNLLKRVGFGPVWLRPWLENQKIHFLSFTSSAIAGLKGESSPQIYFTFPLTILLSL